MFSGENVADASQVSLHFQPARPIAHLARHDQHAAQRRRLAQSTELIEFFLSPVMNLFFSLWLFPNELVFSETFHWSLNFYRQKLVLHWKWTVPSFTEFFFSDAGADGAVEARVHARHRRPLHGPRRQGLVRTGPHRARPGSGRLIFHCCHIFPGLTGIFTVIFKLSLPYSVFVPF